MKEHTHLEAIRSLRRMTGKATDSGAGFQRGRPQGYGHNHRGGGNNGGRSGHQYNQSTAQAEKKTEPTRRSLLSSRTPSEKSKESRRNK